MIELIERLVMDGSEDTQANESMRDAASIQKYMAIALEEVRAFVIRRSGL